MAIKGLSKLVLGEYDHINGVTSYKSCTTTEKMIEYSLTVNVSDNNPLYADNAIAENDKGQFQDGELSLGTDDLTEDSSKLLLGLKENPYTYGDNKTANEIIYDDDAVSPYFGVGLIELHQKNDVDKYKAIFFPKVFFSIPEGSATTKGESIDWQTPSIGGTVMRSDESNDKGKHPWKIDAWFDNENDALEYLQYKCGKTSSVNTANNQ